MSINHNQRFETENTRQSSSINKLTKIKKNVFPHLINSQSSSHVRENSLTHNNTINKYKNSINHMSITTEPEDLQYENIQLKTALNKIKSELMLSKIEIKGLEKEIMKKDKIIHEICPNDPYKSSNYNNEIDQGKVIETQIIHQLKKQFKELRREYDDKVSSYDDLKRTLKNTKVNELIIENKVLTEQFKHMKEMYLASQETIMTLQHNSEEIIVMKEALSKQDFIILNFQENYQKMQEELRDKTAEIDRLLKTKVEKQEVINRLNKKLNFQCQVNDKLANTTENIPGTREFMGMKRELDNKINELKKELGFYKEESDKKDKVIRDIKKNDYANYLSMGKGNDNETKIFNLQNKLSSEKEENERLMIKLKQMTKENNSKGIANANVDGKGNNSLKQGNTSMVGNIDSTSIRVYDRIYSNNISNEEEEYDYMSDNTLNEFIYILLKNFEARKIDLPYIESNIITENILVMLSKDNSIKDAILSISTKICETLSIKNTNEQMDLLAFMKTIIYNFYLALPIKSIDNFKHKFLSCFDGIIFYSKEQCETYNKRLINKLYKHQDELKREFAFFDDYKAGTITFTALKKIIDSVKIILNSDLVEYLIYFMKSDENDLNGFMSIRKLNYTTIIKMMNEFKSAPQGDEDESMIEITNDEYILKVTETINQIRKAMNDNKKGFDMIFLPAKNNICDSNSKNIKESIPLSKVIQILKDALNLELSHLEIFCLYSKVKFEDDTTSTNQQVNPNSFNDPNNEEGIEDIIDYVKFKSVIEHNMNSYIRSLSPKNYQISQGVINENILSVHYDINQAGLIRLIMEKIKQKNVSFERFIFPYHFNMKLEMTSGKYNRYLDLDNFKDFLNKNGIGFNHDSLTSFLISNELLFVHGKINLDYLKVLLLINMEEEKQTSFDKEDIYEEIKDNKANDYELDNIDDESESFKQIQKEIYDEVDNK